MNKISKNMRKEILTIVEEFYQELYKSQRKSHNTPKETGKEKGVIIQGSEDLPEINRDEIKNALRKMKNRKAPGEDGIEAKAIKIGGKVLL